MFDISFWRDKRFAILYYAAIILVVLGVFLNKFQLYVLNPYCIEWLMYPGSDNITDFTTWEYYRYALPSNHLGVFYNYAWPQTIGVGNTSIAPLFAVPLKQIQSILPEKFQYFGWFLFISYYLQAFFADQLFRLLGLPMGILRWVATLCVSIAPALLIRDPHISLCAHWIILACLCFYFDKNLSAVKMMILSVVMPAIAAFTHPYLILFPIALFAATAAQRFEWQISKIVQSLLLITLPLLSVYLSFASMGMFVLDKTESTADGFGFYASNMNTFFNNMGNTTFKALNFPNYLSGQYEGFAYLGAGVLLLCVFLLFYPRYLSLTLFRFCKRHYALIGASIVLAIYATGFVFSFNNHLVYEKRFSDEHRLMLSVFRSSGRYIWLAHYLLIVGSFVLLYRISIRAVFKQWITSSIAIAILIVQLLDIHPLFQKHTFRENFKPPNGYALFDELAKSTPLIYTFYPYLRTMEVEDDVHYLLHAAAKYRTKITGGHLPRPSLHEQYPISDKILQMMNASEWLLEKESVLLLGKKNAFMFAGLLQQQAHLEMNNFGDYCMIYDTANTNIKALVAKHHLPKPIFKMVELDSFLNRYPNHYWLISLKDEGSNALNTAVKNYFAALNSKLAQLKFRDSYVGIFKNKSLAFEQINEEYSSTTQHLNCMTKVKDITLESSSARRKNNSSSIVIDGKEYSPNLRGLNIVILDAKGKLVTTKNFDTFLSSWANEDNQQ